MHLDDCEVFVEWIGPPVRLILFGAGHDAMPLAAIAKQLGGHVTVADGFRRLGADVQPDRRVHVEGRHVPGCEKCG